MRNLTPFQPSDVCKMVDGTQVDVVTRLPDFVNEVRVKEVNDRYVCSYVSSVDSELVLRN